MNWAMTLLMLIIFMLLNKTLMSNFFMGHSKQLKTFSHNKKLPW